MFAEVLDICFILLGLSIAYKSFNLLSYLCLSIYKSIYHSN